MNGEIHRGIHDGGEGSVEWIVWIQILWGSTSQKTQVTGGHRSPVNDPVGYSYGQEDPRVPQAR